MLTAPVTLHAQAQPATEEIEPVEAIIDIQLVTSPGGIEAWLVQDNSIPFMAIEMWFDGGGSLDRPGARGATNLMMALLEEGTGDLDSQEFAAAQEGLAASFGFDTYRDEVVVSAEVLTQNRDEALALLRGAIVEPSFDEGALERVRQQVISGIEYDLTDPDTISGRTFNALAYGDHPYATSLDGTVESVAGLTRDDIVAAHRSALVRDRVSVGVAGDITPEELGALLDELLGDLPGSDLPLPEQAEFMAPGGIEVVEFPVPQSSVLFGNEGITRTDDDFFPYFVMNQILGAGGYRSRLNQEVREERGLTYGISTWTGLSDYIAMHQGAFSSSNDLVAEAIDVVLAEWEDLSENGVTAEELEAAQRYMTGAYPLRFSGNGSIAGTLAAMQADDMPIDYINTRNERVMAVTLEDIQRVAERVIDPETLQFVVVGRPDGLEPSN
ncbi:M16 family metallopeptidase [Gymnodinialimonas hymeniacidonis]|uniref:M16 family metallopeptidase n=1 Tax=Gymnodinialimonas hymeniacidonis TaxID=3126508 RepID=UPI0034C63EBA